MSTTLTRADVFALQAAQERDRAVRREQALREAFVFMIEADGWSDALEALGRVCEDFAGTNLPAGALSWEERANALFLVAKDGDGV